MQKPPEHKDEQLAYDSITNFITRYSIFPDNFNSIHIVPLSPITGRDANIAQKLARIEKLTGSPLESCGFEHSDDSQYACMKTVTGFYCNIKNVTQIPIIKTGVPFGYDTQEEEIGKVYYRARLYYDPDYNLSVIEHEYILVPNELLDSFENIPEV